MFLGIMSRKEVPTSVTLHGDGAGLPMFHYIDPKSTHEVCRNFDMCVIDPTGHSTGQLQMSTSLVEA